MTNNQSKKIEEKTYNFFFLFYGKNTCLMHT